MQLGHKPQPPTGSTRDSDQEGIAPVRARGANGTYWSGVERRRRPDRRAEPTRAWAGLISFLWAPQAPPLRRRAGRRAGDQVGYVDRYTRQDLALLLTIFLLNVADAFLTLLWLGRGGREANPVMDFLLDIGPWAFIAQKCLVVGLWLVILVVHKNFRLARIGLYSALVVYGLLLIVHFGIIISGIEPIRTASGPPPTATFAAQTASPPNPLSRRVITLQQRPELALGHDLMDRDDRPASE
ncbi:MAG: hypothetical protein JRF61_18510 [Deltaproteobacteria bacterium]|nr:hypothetical protein [Deltaproteobacteria bacterium]